MDKNISINNIFNYIKEDYHLVDDSEIFKLISNSIDHLDSIGALNCVHLLRDRSLAIELYGIMPIEISNIHHTKYKRCIIIGSIFIEIGILKIGVTTKLNQTKKSEIYNRIAKFLIDKK